MSEIVDCQILFYTQCVVIVTIRLHSALGLLSSNHSLDTATVVRAKEDFYIRAIILSCVLQKCFFNPNVVFFLVIIIMHLFMVLKEVAVVLLLFQKLAPLRCCHY
jgi:hypothetical protein